MPLKLGLFDLYFKAGGNPSDHQQLLEVVANSGLDVATAAEVLDSKRYSQEVRAAQQQYQRQTQSCSRSSLTGSCGIYAP